METFVIVFLAMVAIYVIVYPFVTKRDDNKEALKKVNEDFNKEDDHYD